MVFSIRSRSSPGATGSNLNKISAMEVAERAVLAATNSVVRMVRALVGTTVGRRQPIHSLSKTKVSTRCQGASRMAQPKTDVTPHRISVFRSMIWHRQASLDNST